MSAQGYLPGVGGERRRDLSQWYTPPKLARAMARWADVRGVGVLEPSAGRGALALAALEEGAACVDAVDADPENVAHLRDVFAPYEYRAHAHPGDFVALAAPEGPCFDVALMNPPYENGQDVAHVLHALAFAHRVVAILQTRVEHSDERLAFWAKVVPVRIARLASRPRFGGDTDPKGDFSVYEFVRRGPLAPVLQYGVSLEWWEGAWS